MGTLSRSDGKVDYLLKELMTEPIIRVEWLAIVSHSAGDRDVFANPHKDVGFFFASP